MALTYAFSAPTKKAFAIARTYESHRISQRRFTFSWSWEAFVWKYNAISQCLLVVKVFGVHYTRISLRYWFGRLWRPWVVWHLYECLKRASVSKIVYKANDKRLLKEKACNRENLWVDKANTWFIHCLSKSHLYDQLIPKSTMCLRNNAYQLLRKTWTSYNTQVTPPPPRHLVWKYTNKTKK